MSDLTSADTLDETSASPPSGKTAATISLMLFLSWVMIVILLHFLRPEMSPLSEFISDYATGPFGALMTIAFLAWAVGLAMLALAAYHGLPLRPRSRTSLVLLSLSSLLMSLVGIFPADPGDVIVSRAGAIHNLASLLFFMLMMIAMLVLSIRLRRAGLLIGWSKALLWFAMAAPISFVLMATLFAGLGVVGLGQRIYVSILIGWLSMLAFGIRIRGFGVADELQQ